MSIRHRSLGQYFDQNTVIWLIPSPKTSLFHVYIWGLSGRTLKFIYLGQQLIGTINVHLKDFGDVDVPFVEQFYLLPEWQGQGLGSHILQEVTNRYPEVRLSVLRNDSKAHGFYIKNGYTAYKQDDWQTYFVRESLAFYYGFNTGLNNN